MRFRTYTCAWLGSRWSESNRSVLVICMAKACLAQKHACIDVANVVAAKSHARVSNQQNKQSVCSRREMAHNLHILMNLSLIHI